MTLALATSDPPTPDRRQHPRVRMSRQVKVFHRAHLSYAPGESIDLSAGGALLELRSPRPMKPGDAIAVLICDEQETGLANSSALVEATVVREAPSRGGVMRVAVRYAHENAARRAA